VLLGLSPDGLPEFATKNCPEKNGERIEVDTACNQIKTIITRGGKLSMHKLKKQ